MGALCEGDLAGDWGPHHESGIGDDWWKHEGYFRDDDIIAYRVSD